MIAVLGGIASGKSTVAKLLAGPDGVVIDADRYARELFDSPHASDWVKETLGEDLVDELGVIDRGAVAQRVFSSPKARRELEGFTHPRIRARIRTEFDRAVEKRKSRIVLDVPLLIENEAGHGLVELTDLLVFVEVDTAEREKRAIERRGWEPGELAAREATQMPLEDKRARADYVIRNDSTLEELERQVADLLQRVGIDA